MLAWWIVNVKWAWRQLSLVPNSQLLRRRRCWGEREKGWRALGTKCGGVPLRAIECGKKIKHQPSQLDKEEKTSNIPYRRIPYRRVPRRYKLSTKSSRYTFPFESFKSANQSSHGVALRCFDCHAKFCLQNGARYSKQQDWIHNVKGKFLYVA